VKSDFHFDTRVALMISPFKRRQIARPQRKLLLKPCEDIASPRRHPEDITLECFSSD
jgi:hypothetical protein